MTGCGTVQCHVYPTALGPMMKTCNERMKITGVEVGGRGSERDARGEGGWGR